MKRSPRALAAAASVMLVASLATGCGTPHTAWVRESALADQMLSRLSLLRAQDVLDLGSSKDADFVREELELRVRVLQNDGKAYYKAADGAGVLRTIQSLQELEPELDALEDRFR